MIGKVLGKRYEIIKKIGDGGMADVYKARCLLLNRFVAVKILRSEFAKDAEFLTRFNTEAQAAAALSHQNIVSIFDVGREGDIEYIVMEHVEGMTLKEYIKKNKMLSWRQSVDFAIQICRALICAHNSGIIHRDIKPQNIIITPEEVLKVTDFGIARAASVSSVTLTGSTMGSVHYLSPEQARGGYTDFKSDIYSLGIVMYAMVNGRLPFEGENTVSVAIKQIQEAPVSPKEYNIAVPLAVENIILKAMNKEQSKRYQTANDLLRDLERAKVDPEAEINMLEIVESEQTKKIPIVTGDITKTAQTDNDERIPKKADESKNNSKESKKTVFWAVITSVVLVAALIVGAVAILYPGMFGGVSANEVKVPDLLGEVYEDIIDQYATKNITLTLVQTVSSEDYEKGEIVSQNPKADKIVKLPLTIEVTVSKGLAEISLENYERKGFIETKLALEDMGIKVREEREESDTIAEGIVIRTSPGANATVKEGETVTLYVSSGVGDKKVLMPNLVELNIQLAKKILADNNLLEGEIREVYSSKQIGTVTEQGVPSNSEVKPYTSVDLWVSIGEQPQSKIVTITIPQNKDKTNIKIVADGKIIHHATHNSSEGAFDITINGKDSVLLEVYYDDVLSRTMSVNL